MFFRNVFIQVLIFQVDYQLSFYGNPMFDFVYFVFTSLKPELVVENLDDLLVFYQAELANAMQMLKIEAKAPSVEQLNLQLQRVGPLVSTLLLDIIPIVIMDRLEPGTVDMTDFSIETMEKMNYHKYNNTRFEQVVKLYLPMWENRGFLNLQLTMDDLPDYLKGAFMVPSEVASETVESTTADVVTAAVAEPADKRYCILF